MEIQVIINKYPAFYRSCTHKSHFLDPVLQEGPASTHHLLDLTEELPSSESKILVSYWDRALTAQNSI